jgi:hypothetical protein
MSGKAMPGAVLPARTAVREMSRTMEESEGHFSLSVLQPLSVTEN